MSHYYTNDPSLASNKKVVSLDINGVHLSFNTDNGVFSKAKIDEGTCYLLKEVLSSNFVGNILDVGCGIGPIGITIAKFFPNTFITMCDVNVRALGLAKENAELNGVKDQVEVIESNVYSNITREDYQTIITNPPIRAGKAVTYLIYKDSYNHLLSGGSLYVVIRKAQGAESASKYIKEVFGNILLIAKHKGYYIYQAKKEK